MKKIYIHELNEAKAAESTIKCFMNRKGKSALTESGYGHFQKLRPEEYDQDYWEYGIGDAPLDKNSPKKEEQEEIGATGQPQEMEEYPQRMEIQDLTYALAEYLSESWIATDTEDDYESLFYAVSDTLAKYKDYPQSDEWEDCKEWCQKHYKEIEEKVKK